MGESVITTVEVFFPQGDTVEISHIDSVSIVGGNLKVQARCCDIERSYVFSIDNIAGYSITRRKNLDDK